MIKWQMQIPRHDVSFGPNRRNQNLKIRAPDRRDILTPVSHVLACFEI